MHGVRDKIKVGAVVSNGGNHFIMGCRSDPVSQHLAPPQATHPKVGRRGTLQIISNLVCQIQSLQEYHTLPGYFIQNNGRNLLEFVLV